MNDSDKSKEQLLRELELLRALIDTLPDRLYVKDKDGRFVIYNKAVIEDADLPPPSDLTGKSDFDTFPAERAKVYHAEEQQIIETGQPIVNLEIYRVHRTGRTSWSLITKLPWRDKSGNIIGIIGSNRDITDRKKAELALQESERRYKTIFESANEGILIAEIETQQFKYANQAICDMLGYTREELCRMTVYDIHPRECAPKIEAEFVSQKQGKRTLASDIPCLRKDGTLLYVDLCTVNVMIDQKQCNVGFFTDITYRKHNEEALRESEHRYKAIFNSATEGIVVTDVETKRHKYANPAACRMFGYTAEEFQQMAVYDIHPKEYMPSVIAGLEAQARGEKTLVPNVPCLHRNGTIFYADIDATCVIIDQRPCNVGLFTNITERKRAEEALRQSEEKFRGLAERSFDTIFVTDAGGGITYISPACERIFGYKPEEMLGDHFMRFLTQSDIQKAMQHFTQDITGGEPTNIIQLEAVKKDGTHAFIELNPSVIFMDGLPVGTQGIIRDITYRKKTQEELQKAHDELEARVRQRTADLANAVEELQKEISERKLAEESLRKAEQRFRTIFENTVVGQYRTTPDGQILLANPALVKMMGCNSFKELARINLEKEGFDPLTPRSIFKQQIEKKSRVIGLESIWIKRDGSKLFVSESSVAVKDEHGKTIYYEGTVLDVTKRKEAEEKLLLYQEHLRSLASQLSLAEEQLRRRIATELHDHISQNLAISKMQLESLAASAAPDQTGSIREITDMLAQTIETTRSLTFELSPPVLYELGFEAAVGWLARQARQRFGLDVDFTDDGLPKPLDTDVRVLLFQAVRELLVNIVKHAKARKAAITTKKSKNNIRITVRDNGVGFDTSENKPRDYTKGGFGLFNIRERLDLIGGSVEIHSKPGHGTRITLISPLLKTEPKKIKETPHSRS